MRAGEARADVERQEILEELQRRVRAGGGRLITTVKALADELQEKPERLYYFIQSFSRNGQLLTTSHGPRGTEFRIPAGRPRKDAAAARPRGVRRAASGSAFCPWCGAAAADDWKFCAACGRPLPRAQ
jgi:hypothetical protein